MQQGEHRGVQLRAEDAGREINGLGDFSQDNQHFQQHLGGKEEGEWAVSCLLGVVFKVELGRSAPGNAHTGNKDSQVLLLLSNCIYG